MHPSLKYLIALQSLDLRIAELAAKLATFPKRLAEAEAPVAAARASLAQARESRTGNVKERKKLELDVETWKDKVRKYRDQTAAVKTNEAYKALLHEIQTAEDEIRKAEDRLLEHMVYGEEHDLQIKLGEKALAAAEAAAKDARRQLEAEQAAIQQEHASLSAEREQAASNIPEDLMARYQRLAKRYHGLAVAQMVDEACTGCRVYLRPHMVQRVRQFDSDEIVECESCTRILYYVEEAAVPPVPNPEVPAPVAQASATEAGQK